jgi:hypothetical protein
MDNLISLAVIVGRSKVNLDRVLDSIAEMSDKPDELLLIYDVKNNGITESVKSDLPIKVIEVFYKGDGMQPHMRNILILKSSCKYMWFVDDDVSIAKDSCRHLRNLILSIDHDLNIGCIAGKIIENKDFDRSRIKIPIYLNAVKGPIGLFDYDDNEFPKELYESVIADDGKSYPIIPFCQGTSMVFDKDKLISVGGFNEELGYGYATFEDSEVNYALKRGGYTTIYSGCFPLVHHKIFRVGDWSRGNEDYVYNKIYIRNYVITLIVNKALGYLKISVYILGFACVQSIRCIKENYNKDLSLIGKVMVPILAISALVGGIFLGLNSVFSTKFKRVNTSQ